jgi:hypothetical protein
MGEFRRAYRILVGRCEERDLFEEVGKDERII